MASEMDALWNAIHDPDNRLSVEEVAILRTRYKELTKLNPQHFIDRIRTKISNISSST